MHTDLRFDKLINRESIITVARDLRLIGLKICTTSNEHLAFPRVFMGQFIDICEIKFHNHSYIFPSSLRQISTFFRKSEERYWLILLLEIV